MIRLQEGEPEAKEILKGRKRLDKVLTAVKDMHRLLWPGAAIPMRDAICSRHRSADAEAPLNLLQH